MEITTKTDMNRDDIYETVKWAEELANRYNLGVNTIINGFVNAKKELNHIDTAKQFIENELGGK